MDTKLGLLMNSLREFYEDTSYIKEVKSIVEQENIISLRILDWFITNFSKKYRISINDFDVYQNYKLQLKSFSKKQFDPFCRKNKVYFYYTDEEFLETSCGQLCFFRWCFQNKILDFVKIHLKIIEDDMKASLREKKTVPTRTRQPLSVSASRSICKKNVKYTVKFE